MQPLRCRETLHKPMIDERYLLILALLTQSAYADTLTDQAQSLFDQDKASEAYQLLEPVEAARSGDVAFDLLFGVVAIDAGKPTRGVFALEPVLAMEPNNARARAEIARAYLALGETKTARAEFETVQKKVCRPKFRPQSIAIWRRSNDWITRRKRPYVAILKARSVTTATSMSGRIKAPLPSLVLAACR